MDCYCNEIVQSLQTKKLRSISYLGAFRLLGEFKPQSFIRPLIKYFKLFASFPIHLSFACQHLACLILLT